MFAKLSKREEHYFNVSDVALPHSTEKTVEKEQSAEIVDVADLTIQVEGKNLRALKVVLGLISPVFKTMFTQDKNEKTETKIDLQENTYQAVYEFIEVTHVGAPVHKDNVLVLLPLAHEYQCNNLLENCDGIIAAKTVTDEGAVDQLILADKYNLPKAKRASFDMLKYKHLEGPRSSFRMEKTPLTKYENFSKIPQQLLVELLMENIRTKDDAIYQCSTGRCSVDCAKKYFGKFQ